MLFNSVIFPYFLLIVLSLFHLSAQKHRSKLLVVASYLFYSAWNWKFSFLLALSTVVDYYCGIKLGETTRKSSSKDKFLYLSILTNLTILGFFKYFNFFAESFSQLLAVIGFESSFVSLNIVLPVGISFYTFQTISYTIEVRKGKLNPIHNFWQFALYVSFFPQLVAGPIERATHLLPQLRVLRAMDSKLFKEGLYLIALGYIKKVGISDQIAGVADYAFSNWENVASSVLWEGLIIFSLQIYLDFSGYSDIARGVAKWFGVDLMVNFRQPYFSQSVSEFWTRWHISLSSWLKEYLYIPLGGNRKGSLRTYFNLMATMLLGGLWHGANFTFVVWGFLHGLYLGIHKFILSRSEASTTPSAPRFIFNILFTNFLILITWLFFRAPNLSAALGYLQKMFAFSGLWEPTGLFFLSSVTLLVFLLDYPLYRSNDEFYFMKLPIPYRISIVLSGFLIVAIVLSQGLGTTGARPFIYFQF